MEAVVQGTSNGAPVYGRQSQWDPWLKVLRTRMLSLSVTPRETPDILRLRVPASPSVHFPRLENMTAGISVKTAHLVRPAVHGKIILVFCRDFFFQFKARSRDKTWLSHITFKLTSTMSSSPEVHAVFPLYSYSADLGKAGPPLVLSLGDLPAPTRPCQSS